MAIYLINPLTDDRWAKLLRANDHASVFHSTGWLDALQRTYNYQPLAATSCAPGTPLTNAIVFCRRESFLTGRRLISLPFSDHCEPLAGSDTEVQDLLNLLPQLLKTLRYPRFEIRPLRVLPSGNSGFAPSAGYFFHQIDLTRSPREVFRSFHKDSIQRKIRRAEREDLIYEEGHSERLMADFYRLQLLTRRRHRLPPQPMAWFRNLAECLGKSMKVRVVYKNGEGIASMITLRFKHLMVYKYGCSDVRHHKLGGMQMLFWRAIQEAIESGLTTFDMGRSEIGNDGLATFKQRWGAQRLLLSYWSIPSAAKATTPTFGHALLGRVFGLLPDRLLVASGQLLYKHLG